ncbi:MAG: biopolymer transporter ExbD [Myxococcota bacterium]
MKRYRSEQDESEVDITPMLDVVFIMLIFFIVTASFVKESGVDVKRPSASSESEQKDKIENILVAITEQDEIYVDQRAVDVRTVRANIERMMAENPKASVIVQAHTNSRNELLVKVIDAAKLAGVENVNLATIE